MLCTRKKFGCFLLIVYPMGIVFLSYIGTRIKTNIPEIPGGYGYGDRYRKPDGYGYGYGDNF